tara:strand:+ start:8430 stop:9662 length:1233 start_codon:yes stop_codon:yes gene_type:complete
MKDIYGKDSVYNQQVWGQGPWGALLDRSRDHVVDYDEWGNPITRDEVIQNQFAGNAELWGQHDLGNVLSGGLSTYKYGADSIQKLEKSILQNMEKGWEHYKEINKNNDNLKFKTLDDYIEGHSLSRAAKEGTLEWDDDYGLMVPDSEGKLIPFAFQEGSDMPYFDATPGTHSIVPRYDTSSPSAIDDRYRTMLPMGYKVVEKQVPVLNDAGEFTGEYKKQKVYVRDDESFDKGFQYDHGYTGLTGIIGRIKELFGKESGKYEKGSHPDKEKTGYLTDFVPSGWTRKGNTFIDPSGNEYENFHRTHAYHILQQGGVVPIQMLEGHITKAKEKETAKAEPESSTTIGYSGGDAIAAIERELNQQGSPEEQIIAAEKDNLLNVAMSGGTGMSGGFGDWLGEGKTLGLFPYQTW